MASKSSESSPPSSPKPTVQGSGISHSSRVASLPRVTPAQAEAFSRLGIVSVTDLLRHLPNRYETVAEECPVAELPKDGLGSARGMIIKSRPVGYGRGSRYEATLEDDTGTLSLVWFNMPYIADRIRAGAMIRVSGKLAVYRDKPQMVNARVETIREDDGAESSDSPPAVGAELRPIYPATQGLPPHTIARVVKSVLPSVLPTLQDPIAPDLLKHHNMPSIAEAYRMVHTPAHDAEPGEGKRRLKYNELLLLQLGITMKRAFVRHRLSAPVVTRPESMKTQIESVLPFKLTPDQQRVWDEIATDLAEDRPMNRLLQGDVGTGKTAVALCAMLIAVLQGQQAAMMAPTELLAEQHHATLSALLEDTSVRLARLTGSDEPAEKQRVLAGLADGTIDLVVGTHALISPSVKYKDLALAVVDEQHRFGVRQRAALRQGTPGDDGRMRCPHVLVMTATPIPRTLAMTVFGDLEVSTLSAPPPGRVPVTNRVVKPDQADEVYGYIKTRLKRGEQAFVVVPTIGDEDAASRLDWDGEPETGEAAEDGATLKSVVDHAEHLRKVFEGYTVETVHGRMATETRQAVMQRFRDRQADVLVATTVIEVGVDVPNATVMVIEHAERFGLAQLHQLRGRVGRGAERRALCVFVSDPTTEDAQRRMEAIGSTNDGFKLAELDLEIRGIGEFFGTKQSGLPPLRVASIPEDMELLQLARRDAEPMIEADPALQAPEHQLLRRVLMHAYGETLGLVDVA